MAVGTRTAPNVSTATAGKILVAISFIDEGGNVRTDGYQLPADTTDAAIEASVAQLANMTAASIYKVVVSREFAGAKLSSNAVNGAKAHVSMNIIASTTDPAAPNSTIGLELPAPDDDLFIPGTDDLDLSNNAFTLLGALAVSFFEPAGANTRYLQHWYFGKQKESGRRTSV